MHIPHTACYILLPFTYHTLSQFNHPSLSQCKYQMPQSFTVPNTTQSHSTYPTLPTLHISHSLTAHMPLTVKDHYHNLSQWQCQIPHYVTVYKPPFFQSAHTTLRHRAHSTICHTAHTSLYHSAHRYSRSL